MEVEAPPKLQSAVRLPTPEPEDKSKSIPAKRKNPSYSRSPSPRRQPNNHDKRSNGVSREAQLADRPRQRQKQEPTKPLTDAEKQELAKAEYQKLLNMRSGGTYIPPARLRALQAQVTDKKSKEFQRMAWEALKKSINGLINKINVSNIKFIVPELFGENLIRGRGLFARSIMKAQAASLPFTPIYAAMAAIVNTKLPQVGELLMNRLVVQFRKAYRRNDKTVCLSATTFIAHLCNQQVVHELLAAQMLQLLLTKPTDDSVEIAVGLTREVGQHLEEMNGPIALLVYDQFRNILHEADIDKRTQYMIEVLFEVRKNRYKDNPAIKEELDLVEEEDQITHEPPALDGEIDVQDGLNIFKFDADYEENEEAYQKLRAEILGEVSDSGEDDDDDDDESSDDEQAQQEKELEIKDQTNTDLTNLRRTIYLTINSSADFEECCHKLMKINLPAGKESELPSMIIETCSQRPTYEKFYGLVGERFAKLNRLWTDQFEGQFEKYYETIHRYETNRLRNIACFFSHILSTDAIGWHVFSVIHLNEEETTSSSRIFIKILFQELREAMGMRKLVEKLKDDILRPSFTGIFPTDHPRNTRFSINYFTSIEMGPVTEEMREYLKNMPKPAPPILPAAGAGQASDSESVSSYSSYSSYTGSSRSRSLSRSPTPRRSSRGRPRDDRSLTRSPSRSRTPVRRRVPVTSTSARSPPRRRSDAHSRSPSPPPRNARGRSYTRSPPYFQPPRRRRSISYSRSRTPPPRARGRPRSYTPSESRSRSPPNRRVRRSPSYSASRSPPPQRSAPRRQSPRRQSPPRRRRNTSSPEASRSPPPPRRRDNRARRNSSSLGVSRSPSRSRSPAPPAARRRRSPSPRRRSPSPRRRSPPLRHRRASPSPSRNNPPPPPPSNARRQSPPKARSPSPFSKRVALTRQLQGQTQR